MKELTIIITTVNEQQETNATVKSIRETAGSEPEIIVVDDHSDIPQTLEDTSVKLIRNIERKGVGGARHTAAQYAEGKNLLITDCHMRFDKNWYEPALEAMRNKPQTLHCGTCLGLSEGNMDLEKHRGAYNGATLCMYNESTNEVLEGKWVAEKEGDNYDLGCLMGAVYFIPKDFYFKLRGLQDLRGWGSDEPFLSLKAWLAGGEVKLLKKVRVGHKFRSAAPYCTWSPWMPYNKLMTIYTVLGQRWYDVFKDKFPVSGDNDAAKRFMEKEKVQMDANRTYYQSIFVHTPEWYMNKFNIKCDVSVPVS